MIFISGTAVSKEINFNAFQVDTSISDIKPVKKEVVPEKLATLKIQNSDLDPNYIRPRSDFGTTQLERMNQNARHSNSSM